MKNFFIIFILIYCINPLILKAIEPEEILSNSAFENRARNLSKGIRCLVCQNQTIDDSDSELAKDLRSIIRKKIVQGDTDDEINKFLVDRYGNFILMKPPIKNVDSIHTNKSYGFKMSQTVLTSDFVDATLSTIKASPEGPP